MLARRMTDPQRETALRFNRAFEEEGALTGGEGPSGFDAKLLAQRWILGPLAVERARRAPLGLPATFADRVADPAVVLQTAPRGDADVHSATSKYLGPCVTAALRAHAARATLELGPNAPTDRLLEVCAPLVADGLTTTPLDAPAASAATVVVAPFFYAPFDLARLADHLALERVHASPFADGGLRLIVATRWEQRKKLLDLVRERVMDRDATPMEAQVVEEEEIPRLLDSVEPDGFVSAFVYPMWLEREVVRDAVEALAARSKGFILNARPSIAFWMGGESTARFDAPQLLRPAPSLAWCRRRTLYEREPTLSGALSSAIRAWVPSLAFR
jgi:hypothetical protein